MRLLIVSVLALVAVVCATPLNEQEYKVADKEFLIRNKQIIKLLEHVMQPIKYQEMRKIAEEYSIESNIDKYQNVDAVKEFAHYWKLGMIPLMDMFSIVNLKHREQAIALFHVLYYAKDWDTFYKTAVWARAHMNAGLFVYSMNVAVLHRKDTRGMILPAPYEIYPYYFVNSEVIQKAYYMKMSMNMNTHEKAHGMFGITVDQNDVTIVANYTGWHVQTNMEQKLSYFMEDIGLNSYYYYFHSNYPFWMGGDEFGLNNDRRGERFYFIYQQLLARFYLERLSNCMGTISNLAWWLPVKTGYYSSLRYPTGMEFPYRQDNYVIMNEKTVYDVMKVEDLERRIRDAIFSGYATMPDGSRVNLKKWEDVNVLGELIESSEEFMKNRYYRYVWIVARTILGGSPGTFDKSKVAPSVLEHFETSLRDPVFWQLYKRIIQKFIYFKNILPSYTKEQLLFPGVKVEKVVTDKLVTYFDYYKYDISNAIYLNDVEMKNEKDDRMYMVKQLRLNHEPFTVKMEVQSDKATESVVRVFLGPKKDVMNRMYALDDNRLNFIMLDKFTFQLKTGINKIERKSSEFFFTVKDRTMTSDLLKKMESAIGGEEQFILDNSENLSGFPNRLILPKGTKGGMIFQLYVIVTPRRVPEIAQGSTDDMRRWHGVGTGGRNIDTLPFGYPFDRAIDTTYFWSPNMYIMDVPIFHKTKYEINTMTVNTVTDDNQVAY